MAAGVKKLVLQRSPFMISWVMTLMKRWHCTYRWWGGRCCWRWVSRSRCWRTWRWARGPPTASWSRRTRAGTAGTGSDGKFLCQKLHHQFLSDNFCLLRINGQWWEQKQEKLWNSEMPKIDRWLQHEWSAWLCTIAIHQDWSIRAVCGALCFSFEQTRFLPEFRGGIHQPPIPTICCSSLRLYRRHRGESLCCTEEAAEVLQALHLHWHLHQPDLKHFHWEESVSLALVFAFCFNTFV